MRWKGRRESTNIEDRREKPMKNQESLKKKRQTSTPKQDRPSSGRDPNSGMNEEKWVNEISRLEKEAQERNRKSGARTRDVQRGADSIADRAKRNNMKKGLNELADKIKKTKKK